MNIMSDRVDKSSVDAEFDTNNPNKLPRGCLWHGATVLREAKMTGKGVKVGIIDAGIDGKHPGFKPKNKTIVKQDPGRRPNPPEGAAYERTTHMAGTIRFMAPDVKICDYRAFNDKNDDNSKLMDKISRFLETAVLVDEVDLVLLPIGLTHENKGLEKAIQTAKDKGVYVVCPARKDGVKKNVSEAVRDTVFAVEGVEKKKNLPKIWTAEEGVDIDYVAQGSNEDSMKWGGGFFEMTGSTVAAAHFTGLLACIFSNGKLENRKNRKDLRHTINEKYNVKINTPSGEDYGNGIATALAGQEGVNRFTDLHGKVKEIANTEIQTGPGQVVQ